VRQMGTGVVRSSGAGWRTEWRTRPANRLPKRIPLGHSHSLWGPYRGQTRGKSANLTVPLPRFSPQIGLVPAWGYRGCRQAHVSMASTYGRPRRRRRGGRGRDRLATPAARRLRGLGVAQKALRPDHLPAAKRPDPGCGGVERDSNSASPVRISSTNSSRPPTLSVPRQARTREQ
jgi:hypothetical protein